jgi:hypothetical protein
VRSCSYRVIFLTAVAIDVDGYVCRGQTFRYTGFIESDDGLCFMESSF